MTTGGKFNILTSTGRCSIISNEIAFNNLGDSYNREEQTSAHGKTASFEYIAAQDPEWIFCLDRDTASKLQVQHLLKVVFKH